MSTVGFSIQQKRIAETVSHQYGVPKDKVYFPYEREPDRPWLGAEALMVIARNSPEVSGVMERFDKYEPTLQQIFHLATVTTTDGHTFERTGVASIGEKLKGVPDEEVDEHELAAARAIRKALADAGVDPFSNVRSEEPAEAVPASAGVQEAALRTRDLAEIHMLAEEKGLVSVVGGKKDDSKYRRWLNRHCSGLGIGDVTSAVNLGPKERASVIQALRQLGNEAYV